MEKCELKKGDVVQLSPELRTFGGCLMIVSEPKAFGAQGYIQIPGQGQAYFRPRFEDMEFVGKAVWEIAVDDCEE